MAPEKQHDNLSSGLYKKACTCTLPNTHTHTHTPQPYRKIKYVLLQNFIRFLKYRKHTIPIHFNALILVIGPVERVYLFVCHCEL